MVAMLIFGFTIYAPIDWNHVATGVPGSILRVFGVYKVSCIEEVGIGLGPAVYATITTTTHSSAPLGYVAHDQGGICTYLNG